jgi:hypothetical protein
MTYDRRNVSSGSPFEPRVGISRAVRLGPLVTVAGNAPLGPDGRTVGRGDARPRLAGRDRSGCGCHASGLGVSPLRSLTSGCSCRAPLNERRRPPRR